MKASTILSSIALAAAAIAEPLPLDRPSRVARDGVVANSVIAQVSAAITQLDNSVKIFAGDASKVKIDASSLVKILDSGVASVNASTNLTVADATGLQPLITSLQTAGQSLVDDLGTKKTEFEQAGLCTTVESTVSSISAAAISLINAIVAKVPEEALSSVAGLRSGLQSTLAQGVAAFAPGECTDSTTSASSAPVSSTAPATGASSFTTLTYSTLTPVATVATEQPTSVSTPQGGTVVITQTVTATGQCSEVTTSASTLTSTSIATIIITSTHLSSSTSTIRSNSTIIPTGGSTTTTSPPIITAGAVANAVGPVGVIAGIFAVLMF